MTASKPLAAADRADLRRDATAALDRGLTPVEVAATVGCSVAYVESLRAVLERDRAAAASVPAQTRRSTPAMLEVRLIDPHPDNPRDDVGDVSELADSIRAQGLLQPLLVTPHVDDRYRVIAGHRRLAAVQSIGIDRVPVVIRGDIAPAAAVEAMLTENLQRQELNPIEEARGYQHLLDMGRSQVEIARATGRSQFTVSARLSLLNLTPEEQELVARGEVTISAGYRAGRDRAPRPSAARGKTKPKPTTVPHFTFKHPLADVVHRACEAAGHAILGRLGPACGPCWESAIRQAATDEAIAWARS